MDEPKFPPYTITAVVAVKIDGIGEVHAWVESGAVVVEAKKGILRATRRLTPAQAYQASDAAADLAEGLANAALLAEREGEHG